LGNKIQKTLQKEGIIMKKRFLCYGDSNTWGVIPRFVASSTPSERYDEQTRWPRVCASVLGDDWTLIEEGLGGRTTMYRVPGESYRMGDWYLHPCLLSHRPLDYVVLMLGTNDLQTRMHQEPFTKDQLSKGLIRLIQIIRALPQCGAGNKPPRILVVAPPPVKISESRPEVSERLGREAGVALSHEFAPVYKEVADTYHCGFLDASLYAEASDADGVHFTKESHPRLGQAVAKAILDMEAEKDAWEPEPADPSVLAVNIEM